MKSKPAFISLQLLWKRQMLTECHVSWINLVQGPFIKQMVLCFPEAAVCQANSLCKYRKCRGRRGFVMACLQQFFLFNFGWWGIVVAVVVIHTLKILKIKTISFYIPNVAPYCWSFRPWLSCKAEHNFMERNLQCTCLPNWMTWFLCRFSVGLSIKEKAWGGKGIRPNEM